MQCWPNQDYLTTFLLLLTSLSRQAPLVGTNSTRCFFTSNSHYYRSPFSPYYVVLCTIVILCLCLLTPLPSRCLTFLRFWPPCCLILNCCLFCIYKGDKQCCLKTFVVFIWSVGLLRAFRCLTLEDRTACFLGQPLALNMQCQRSSGLQMQLYNENLLNCKDWQHSTVI